MKNQFFGIILRGALFGIVSLGWVSTTFASSYEWAVTPTILLIGEAEKNPVCFGITRFSDESLFPTLCVAHEDPRNRGTYICPSATACALEEVDSIAHAPLSRVEGQH